MAREKQAKERPPRWCGALDAERLDGKLLVVTNTDFAPSDVIARYKALAEIERGFRVLKSDIDIDIVPRPPSPT